MVKWQRGILWCWEHDDVIKWKHYPGYWPIVRGIHRWPVFSLICPWTNGWINNRDAGDFRHRRADYDVTVMEVCFLAVWNKLWGMSCIKTLLVTPILQGYFIGTGVMIWAILKDIGKIIRYITSTKHIKYDGIMTWERLLDLCEGYSSVTGGFLSQSAGYATRWWCLLRF